MLLYKTRLNGKCYIAVVVWVIAHSKGNLLSVHKFFFFFTFDMILFVCSCTTIELKVMDGRTDGRMDGRTDGQTHDSTCCSLADPMPLTGGDLTLLRLCGEPVYLM